MGRWDQGAEWRWGSNKGREGCLEGQDHSCFAFLPRCASQAFLRDPSAVLTLPLYLCLQGIINLGTSENKLCFDLLSRRVSPSAPLRGINSSLSALGLPWKASLTRACCLPLQPWPESQQTRFQIFLRDNFLCGLGRVTSLFWSCFTSSHTQTLLLAGSCCWGGGHTGVWSAFNNCFWGREDSDL